MAEQQQQRSGPAAAAAELPAPLQSAPRFVKVAATQMACSWDTEANVKKAEDLVRAAAADGANIILLQVCYKLSAHLLQCHCLTHACPLACSLSSRACPPPAGAV